MVAVVLQGLVVRFPLCIGVVWRFLLVGTPVGILLTVACAYALGLNEVMLAAVLLYALLCELYMFTFTLLIGSVSVTILLALRRGPVDVAGIASRFEPEEMVRVRIERLVSAGFVVRDGKRLLIAPKGRALHYVFFVLRRFSGHLTAK